MLCHVRASPCLPIAFSLFLMFVLLRYCFFALSTGSRSRQCRSLSPSCQSVYYILCMPSRSHRTQTALPSAFLTLVSIPLPPSRPVHRPETWSATTGSLMGPIPLRRDEPSTTVFNARVTAPPSTRRHKRMMFTGSSVSISDKRIRTWQSKDLDTLQRAFG